MYTTSEHLYQSYTAVKAELDTFTTGPAINDFNDAASNLKYLHILPWILVLSTVFFALMWMKNGACCCCTNGSFLQCLALALPQAIFWLLAFIVMLIFAAIGYAFQFFVLEQHVSQFRGNPTAGALLEHFQTAFPEFWAVVFQDLEDGLSLFRTSATIFVLACFVVAFYSCFFCCLRPYSIEGQKGGSAV